MDIALITGASRGLGLALAQELAERGHGLVVDARGAEALEEARSALARHTAVTAIAGDVADPDHRSELVAAATRMGELRLLVNNASVLGPSPQPELGPTRSRCSTRSTASTCSPRWDCFSWPCRPSAETRARSSTSRPTPRSRTTPAGAGTARPRRRSSSSPTCSPPSSRTCACTGPTPATCVPACTRRPSRERTSPTGRSRRRACPDCCG